VRKIPPLRETSTRRAPERRRGGFEVLEDRTLLSVGGGSLPLGPSGTAEGLVAPGAPLVYQLDPAENGRLIARVHAAGVEARLSLLNAQGQVLLQSDGLSTGVIDPVIDLHVSAGPLYLEVESLRGAGDALLTTTLTATSDPSSMLLRDGVPQVSVDSAPLAIGDFNKDGVTDFVDPVGVHLGAGDGAFRQPPPSTSLDPGGDISAIVVADFNGDGRADVAFADRVTGNVEVRAGNGDGTFQDAVIVAQLSSPSALATADFNRDGLPDLAIADDNSNTVTILFNTGGGTFRTLDPIPVGQSPEALATGDFDGNGLTDLAVADYGSGDVQILLSQPGGTFLPPALVPASLGGPIALAVGDFDHNGSLDLAVADMDSSDVTLLLNQGRGTFAAGTTVALPESPLSLAAADFNSDGTPDLAVGEINPIPQAGSVSILLTKAGGTLGAPVTVLDGIKPGTIAPADLNGDGLPDLIVNHFYTFDVSILLGTGGGQFLPSSAPGTTPTAVGDFNNDGIPDFVAPDGVHLGTGDGTFLIPPIGLPIDPGSAPSAFAVGDFNGDGQSDVAVTDFLSDDVLILLGNGDGTFRRAGVIPVGERPAAIVSGDFNNDGRSDLAVADNFSGDVTILPGNGDGTFRNAGTVATGRRPDAITTADFNDDGRPDLAVADAAAGVVTILLGDGQGSFQAAGTVAVGQDPDALLAADFNGDGRPDLAVAVAGGLPGTGGVTILTGIGNGTFRTGETIALGKISNPVGMVIGDFNGDGHTDLAVADYFSEDVTVLLNSGHGDFRSATPVGLAQNPYALASGDFNGDHRDDLIVANENAVSFSVLLGIGNGLFRDGNANPVGLKPEGLASGDFNGDGWPDLAVPNELSHDVSILLGNGDGTFRSAGTIAVGQNPSAILAVDLNGDGRLDLVVANQVSNDVTILLGRGDGTFRSLGAVPVGAFPDAVASGDFNHDGIPDLAVSNLLSNDVTILLGRGDGTFRDARANVTGGFPFSIATGDFNGDGKTDLAVAFYRDSDLVILPGLGDGTFGEPQVIATGQSPESVVNGDFNGDGKTDLAVAVDPNLVMILKGDGHGNFQLANTFTVDPGPLFLYPGDFKGDGKTDLAVIYAATNQVTVSLGNGDFTFRDPTRLDLSSYGAPAALVTADLNGDGLSDLAFAFQDPSDLRVRLSLGGTEFSDPAAVALTTRDVPFLADLNGDGTPDMTVVDAKGEILFRRGRPNQPGFFDPPIVVNPGFPSRDVAVVSTGRALLLASVDSFDNAISLFQFGAAGFERVWSLPTGPLPAQIVVGDLNGDGKTDLVVRNAGSDTLTVYFNDAYAPHLHSAIGPIATPPFGERFLEPLTIPVGAGISDVTLADLDGDGRLDIVVTDKLSGEIRVLRNLDGRSFAAPSVFKAGSGLYGVGADGVSSLEATAGVVAAPITAGAPSDLVALNPGSNTLTLLSALGDARFTNPQAFPTNEPARMVRAADFNGDGLPDLAVLDDTGLEIFLNDGRGGFFAPTLLVAGTGPSGLTVADVNGDGKLDLVVSNAFGDVLTLRGRGDGTFMPVDPVEKRVALAVQSIRPGALPTVVLADAGRNLVETIRDGLQSVVADAASGLLAPGAVQLADLNGDGIPDLIVANSGSNNILVYPGLPNGLFGPALNGGHGYFTGTDPVGITVADLDGDGRPDLVVANKGSNDVSVFLNRTVGGEMTFVPGPRLSAGFGPTATAVADVNHDGKPDILVTDSLSNDVRLLIARGNGFFEDLNPTIFHTGESPGPVFVFNPRPGQTDVVTLNAGSNDLTLIPNIGGGGVVVPQSIPSGGSIPVAGVELDLVGGATGLLVANNGDGRLALFLSGADGLEFERLLDDPGVHPTALATDQAGNVFAGFEGGETALLVTLGLAPTGAQEGGGVGASVLPSGLGETQVALLIALRDSSPLAVATLLSVTPIENPETPALPNQGAPRTLVRDPLDPLDESEVDHVPTSEGDGDRASAAQDDEPPDPLVRIVAGLDEAFDRAPREPRADPPLGESSRAVEPTPLLMPMRNRPNEPDRIVPSPNETVVDAALESLGDEEEAAAWSIHREPSIQPVGAAVLGLGALSLVSYDLIRPHFPRRAGRGVLKFRR
jgi:hypothetical protein